MSFLGNLIWIIFGGLVGAIGWCFVGIPFAAQALKMAKLSLMPFGKEIR